MPETQTVTRRGKIFEFGDFPDKSFVLTPEEWAAANADLESVPLDLEHRKTILDGHLGHARDFEVRGNSIFGAIEIPEWLAKITEGVPIKVSAAFHPIVKRLQKLSLVLAPRIPDAAVFHAAFSAGAIPELPAEFAGDSEGHWVTLDEGQHVFITSGGAVLATHDAINKHFKGKGTPEKAAGVIAGKPGPGEKAPEVPTGNMTPAERAAHDRVTTAKKPDRSEVARHVADAVKDYSDGHSARTWKSDDGKHVRVYVSRQLSRGRQDMGHIAIHPNGRREYNLDRNKAGIRDHVERHLKGVGFSATPSRLSLGALYHRWRAAGRPRVFTPLVTMSDPIQTRSGQSKIQAVHDITASHPGVCPGMLGKGGYTGADPLKDEDTPLPAAKFGDRTNEHKTLQDIHDRAVSGGADCDSATMSATSPGKKPMTANFLEMFKFWKKAGEPEDFEIDLAKFSAPEPEPKPPAAPVAPVAQAWTESTEYQAMAAEIKAMKAKAEADRVAQIDRDAVAFAADLVRAGKLRPPDAANVAATYRTAALDDAAHPTEVTFSADGQERKGGRLDQLKATWASMPAVMNLGRELVNPSADLAGFTVLSPDRQPADPNKPPDKARVDYLLSLSPAGNGVLAARKPA